MNITKLSIWAQLQGMGFVPITYRAHGRKVATGAALQRTGTDIHGNPFATDIVCIEPQTHGHSDRRNYHVTGAGANEFYKAAEILPTVKKLLSNIKTENK